MMDRSGIGPKGINLLDAFLSVPYCMVLLVLQPLWWDHYQVVRGYSDWVAYVHLRRDSGAP